MPTPRMDLCRTRLTLTEEAGRPAILVSDGAIEVLWACPEATDERALSFELTRLERRLQGLGGELRV